VLVALMAVLTVGACGGSSGPLAVPSWMGPTGSWRAVSQDDSRLDLTIERHVGAYRERYGVPAFREFAVLPPKGVDDVTAAIDAALKAAGRTATRQRVPEPADGEQEFHWVDGDGKPVVLVYLSHTALGGLATPAPDADSTAGSSAPASSSQPVASAQTASGGAVPEQAPDIALLFEPT
jgi:hypothetical protein